MILHPGILSLVVGSFLVTAMAAYASALGVVILRRWDIGSSSAAQLALERKTYLLSTIMNYVFGLEIASILLYVYTLDDLHRLFVGAMCATGSLNANPIGWLALYAKIAVFFLSSAWIAINVLDQQAEDYPLVKVKYALSLALTPLLALDAYLQLRYFLGLKPDIITSCCGSLFSAAGPGIASGLAALPVRPAMAAFYGTIALFLAGALLTLRYRSALLRVAVAMSALLLFFVALAGIVSFVSLYYYEIPTHHCPFDLLQSGYHFVGFPLYATLFGGVFYGVVPGVVEPFSRRASLRGPVARCQRRWTLRAVVLITAFCLIASWPIVFSSFTMEGYW